MLPKRSVGGAGGDPCSPVGAGLFWRGVGGWASSDVSFPATAARSLVALGLFTRIVLGTGTRFVEVW